MQPGYLGKQLMGYWIFRPDKTGYRVRKSTIFATGMEVNGIWNIQRSTIPSTAIKVIKQNIKGASF